MRIAIDRNIPFAERAFSGLGDVRLLATTEIAPGTVRDADVLVVRSETNVSERLLGDSGVRFVGTATIGTDHLDLPWLESRGIAVASAPGSNANSVKEYLLAALLTLGARFGLRGRTLGVVGVGNIGSRVARMAEDLGMEVLLNDPPRARAGGGPAFESLDRIMDADIVTLHVPLTREGPDPTYHLLGRRRLGMMKKGSVLVNTSRGAVVETDALKDALRGGALGGAVLDVWEGEPSIDADLLSLTTLGTPHIAGYSLDGKVNAVRIIREAVRRFLGLDAPWDPAAELPPSSVSALHFRAGAGAPELLLREAVRRCYDIEMDDAGLRALPGLPPEQRAERFRNLRVGYRVRREFMNTTVHLPEGDTTLAAMLKAAGFRTVTEVT